MAAIGGLFTMINSACGGPFILSSDPNSPFIYNGGGFVAIGDVNGDGKPDLVSVDSLNDVVIVETNAGNGVFSYSQGPLAYFTGANPVMVAIADINGDGKPDLVVANQGGNSITILTNNGAGIFGSYATYPVAVSPTFLLVTDINGDGRPDIIIASQNTSLNPYVGSLTILTNAGGTFPVAHNIVVNNVNTLIDSMAVADINGDGKPDLVVGGQDYDNSGKSLTEILTNAGGGFFVSNAVVSAPFSSGPVSVVASDFNKDGQMDIAFLTPGILEVCTNRNGILTTSQTIFLPLGFPVPPGPLLPTAPVGVSYNQLMVADLDGDGYPDLLFTGVMDNGIGYDWILKILFNTGTGGLFETNYLSAGATGAAGVTNSTDMYLSGNTPKLWTAVADLNGDGKADLVGAVPGGPAPYISALFVMTNDISNLISLAVPTNIIANATSSSGAVVNFLPTWTNWMGALLVTNLYYPSGPVFPSGSLLPVQATNRILSSTAYFFKSNLSASTNTILNVIVLDIPTFTLLGPNPLTNFVDGYVDPGVTLSDPYAAVYYISSNVDTNVPGTYKVTYSATNYFGNVGVTNRTVVLIPQPPLGIASSPGGQAALFWSATGVTNYTIQMTTNLNSGPWVTVTNSTPLMGIFVTNSLPAAFFRLQPQ